MRIRALNPGELWKLKDLADQFYSEGKLPGRFVLQQFEKSWKHFIGARLGVIFGAFETASDEKPIGAIGGIVYADPNDGDIVGMECFWYIQEEHRGGGTILLEFFEKWAKVRGAKRVIMIHISGLMEERLKKFYERRGYRELETHFIREV